jgi:hypothetical protein
LPRAVAKLGATILSGDICVHPTRSLKKSCTSSGSEMPYGSRWSELYPDHPL